MKGERTGPAEPCAGRLGGYTQSSSSARRNARRHEAGQVVVFVALLLPVLFGLGAIVMDIGNWYVHKRHLQTQVDAAALAGATKFVGCSSVVGDPVAANEAIRASALTYAGDTNRVPTPADTFNTQEQEPADVHVVLNSNRYWAPGDDTTQGIGLDDTLDPDGDGNLATPGDPCTTKTLDVKATDDEAPLLWGLLPASPSPKSKARVEIQQVLEQAGMLPWAVPDIEPAAVAALFVDENTGVVTDWQRLCNTSVCMGLPTPDDKLSYWATPAFQDPVDLVGENMGVVILVSKENPTPSLTTGAGALTTMCTQSPGLVSCHGGDGNQDGISFIHGWSQLPGGTRASPQIRDVWVKSLTCGDDLSAPYFLRAGDCDLGVDAVIDFGVEGDPSIAQPVGASAEVTLSAPGCQGQGCGMEYVGPAPCCTPTDSLWRTTSSANVGTAVGRTNFSIEWETVLLDGTSRSGTFGGVAHPYVADEDSGPVEYLKLTTYEPGVLDANSRNSGPDRSVVVTVGLRKPLRIEDPLAPPMLLRVASPSGSQNQALDCDKAFNFRTEIENGCQTTYRVNYFDWSDPKDGTYEWADILCDAYDTGDLPPQEIVNDPPPNCVAIETGDKLGQLRQGLQARFETPECHANNWPDEEDEIDDFFAPGGYDFANDPRYVTLIITDFSTFESSGNDQVPVKYFAGFYVTGWDVQGNVKPCLDNDPHPWYGENYRQSLDNGDVWGHFVNLVVFSSTGRGSDELCNFDGIGNCIAVLVE